MASVLTIFISTSQSFSAGQQLDPTTGLIIDEGYRTVDAYCIGCHKVRMIREHGTTREGWIITVRKMQTLGRWRFSLLAESLVVDYLSKNYPEDSSTNK